MSYWSGHVWFLIKYSSMAVGNYSFAHKIQLIENKTKHYLPSSPPPHSPKRTAWSSWLEMFEKVTAKIIITSHTMTRLHEDTTRQGASWWLPRMVVVSSNWRGQWDQHSVRRKTIHWPVTKSHTGALYALEFQVSEALVITEIMVMESEYEFYRTYTSLYTIWLYKEIASLLSKIHWYSSMSNRWRASLRSNLDDRGTAVRYKVSSQQVLLGVQGRFQVKQWPSLSVPWN